MSQNIKIVENVLSKVHDKVSTLENYVVNDFITYGESTKIAEKFDIELDDEHVIRRNRKIQEVSRKLKIKKPSKDDRFISINSWIDRRIKICKNCPKWVVSEKKCSIKPGCTMCWLKKPKSICADANNQKWGEYNVKHGTMWTYDNGIEVFKSVAQTIKSSILPSIEMWNLAAIKRVFGNIDSIAIVGNGPLNNNDIEVASNSDVVVRFNSYDDRLNRCDILLTTLDHSIIDAKQVVLAIPSPFKVDSTDNILSKSKLSNVCMVNPYINYKCCEELDLESFGYTHPMPSSGFTALYHLYQFNSELNHYVCGFNWKYDKSTNTIDGRKIDYNYKPFGHHYVREALWVKNNLMTHPNWVFSTVASEVLSLF